MMCRFPRRLAASAAALLLSGCVAATAEQPTVAPPVPVLNVAGLEAVMGRNAGALQTLFGQADLDVREGTARKLQFIGPACVLDAYLYPRAGSEAVVTWLDARQPNGNDIDRASCVAALIARKQVR